MSLFRGGIDAHPVDALIHEVTWSVARSGIIVGFKGRNTHYTLADGKYVIEGRF